MRARPPETDCGTRSGIEYASLKQSSNSRSTFRKSVAFPWAPHRVSVAGGGVWDEDSRYAAASN